MSNEKRIPNPGGGTRIVKEVNSSHGWTTQTDYDKYGNRLSEIKTYHDTGDQWEVNHLGDTVRIVGNDGRFD